MGSDLEELLAQQLTRAGLTGFEREVVFAKPRRFRFDFVWPCGVAIEVDGLVRSSRGGHQSIGGVEDDHLKDAIAGFLGYTVRRVDGKMIKSGLAVRVVEDLLAQKGVVAVRDSNRQALIVAFKLTPKAPASRQRVAKPKVADCTADAVAPPSRRTGRATALVQASPGGPVSKLAKKHPGFGVDEVVVEPPACSPGIPTWAFPSCPEWRGADLSRFSPAAIAEAVQWAKDSAEDLKGLAPRVVKQAIEQQAAAAERRMRHA